MAQRPAPAPETVFDEPGIQIMIVLILIGVGIYMGITKFETQISLVLMEMARILLWPIHFVLSQLGNGLPYYPKLVNGEYPHEYTFALALSSKMFLWYSPIIIGGGAWLTVRSLTRNLAFLTSGMLKPDEIWAVNAFNTSATIPTFGRKIDEEPDFSGPWRYPLSPPMYCAQYGILEIKEGDHWKDYPFELNEAKMLSRAPIKTINDVRINERKLEIQLRKDLGKPYKGMRKMINDSPVNAMLAYLFLSRIVFGKEYGYKIQDDINRAFAIVKPPTFFHRIPRIIPLPFSLETVEKYNKKENIKEKIIDLMDYNQYKLDYLRSQVSALKKYRSDLLDGKSVTYTVPKPHEDLAVLEKKFNKTTGKGKSKKGKKTKSADQTAEWAKIEIEKLTRQITASVDLDAIINQHAYEYTVLYRLYEEAAKNGVLTTGEFIWLRPINNHLFFSLNNKGRVASGHIEGCAVHFHAKCEMRLKKKIKEPIFAKLIIGIRREVDSFISK